MISPRVSVLLPVYNGEKYIVSTLDTIVEQTYKDWELVIMDGGSKDRTVEIATEYSKLYGNIRVYSEKDEGAYDAIHKALNLSRGEFILVICASDGYLAKDWLERCVKEMDSDEEVSLVWGIPYDMREDGKMLGPHFVYAPYLESPEPSRGLLGKIFSRVDFKHPLRTLRKFNSTNFSLLRHVTTRTIVPQKKDWFYHWLKTGITFPDGNSCVARKIFMEYLPPYHKGTREAGDWMKFYFDFNKNGYLAKCIPIPANYGRLSPGQISETNKKYIEDRRAEYWRNLAELKDELRNDPNKVKFKNRNGEYIS